MAPTSKRCASVSTSSSRAPRESLDDSRWATRPTSCDKGDAMRDESVGVECASSGFSASGPTGSAATVAHAPAATGTARTALRACRETARNACGGRRTMNATRNGVSSSKSNYFGRRIPRSELYVCNDSPEHNSVLVICTALARPTSGPGRRRPRTCSRQTKKSLRIRHATAHRATGNRTSHPANLLAAWRRFHDHPQEGLTPCRLPSCFVFCDHTRMPSCFVFCDPPEGGFFLFLGAVFGRRRAEGLAEGREAHAK